MASPGRVAVRRNLAMERLSRILGGPSDAGHLGSSGMDVEGEARLLEILADGFEKILDRLDQDAPKQASLV